MTDNQLEPDDGQDLFEEQRFEMDGPSLFGGDELAEAAPPDVPPATTTEPDDGLAGDPVDDVVLGNAGALVPDDEPASQDAEATGLDAETLADADADGLAPREPQGLQAPAARAPRAVDSAPAAPLALYRRYRPETFGEVIGQEHVTEPLQRALKNNKVNHAYLFSGPRGCGKTTSARILARCLNCEQGPTPTPCGVCQSCRDLARGGNGSIDVIEIDAASHGGVDDARDLRESAFFAPVSSRYKIYIIDEAHMVTTQGFNAMLKLVEEPPPHVKFIFATTEPEKVIGTVRSRTHHYPFRLVPPKVLQNYLATLCEAEGVQVETAVLPLVVRAGAGSVRDSLSVLDQLLGGAADGGVSYSQASALLGYTPDALLDEIMDAFAAGDAAGVFATIDKVIEVGQDPRRFAEDLLRRLRDLVIVAAVPDAVSSGLIDVAADQAERLETQANGMGAGELTRAAEVIATGLTDMRGTTAPRLHLELMCARVLLPGADVDDRGIHARLDRLERRIGMAGAPQAPADPSAGQWSPDEIGSQAAASSFVSHRDAQPGRDSRRDAGAGRDEPEVAHSTARLVSEPQHFEDAPPPPPAQQRPAQQAPAQSAAAPSSAPASSPAAPAQPTGQRPAGQRPAGQRPVAVEQRVTQTAAAASASAPASAGATITAADVRRLWPQVLEEVKARRRFAWILLSQNAQVVDVSQGVLTLGFANPGARDRFTSGGSQDVLRDCMVEVMGADLRVDAILESGPSGGGRGGSAGTPGRGGSDPRGGGSQPQSAGHAATPGANPASAAPGQPAAGSAPAAPAASPGRSEDWGDVPTPPEPADDGDPGPSMPPEGDEPADAGQAPADTHRWTEQARQNIRPTSNAPVEKGPDVDESQLVSEDDETLDESGQSATELITRTLGGTVIAEEDPGF